MKKTPEEDGYHVVQLDDAWGNYSELWRIPFNKTTPAYSHLNGCGINPVDAKVYCALHIDSVVETPAWKKLIDKSAPAAFPLTQAYVVRLDNTTVEFVAALPWLNFNAGGFGLSGAFYLSTPDSHMLVLQNLSSATGYPAGNRTYGKLLKFTKADMVKPPTWYLVSDLVSFKYDFGYGQGDVEYVLGLHGPYLQIALYNFTKKIFTDSFKLPIGPSRWDNFYGAGWNFQGNLYFASNRGSGVRYIPLDLVNVTSSSELDLPRVGPSEEVHNNDGMNCMTMPVPTTWTATTTVLPTTSLGDIGIR